MRPTRVAWLAGLYDGEGAVGLTVARPGAGSYRPTVQLSMTHLPTIEAAREVLLGIGVTVLGYSYQEKVPERQLPAHHLRVNRMAQQRLLARALLPHAVTKAAHWSALLAFLDLRLEGADLDAQGRVKRGGSGQWWHPYTEAEHAAAERLRVLNRRGAAAVAARAAGG